MDRNGLDFEKEVAHGDRGGFVGELLRFLRESKKWWLVPILVTLLLVAILVLVAGSAAAPFVYTLF